MEYNIKAFYDIYDICKNINISSLPCNIQKAVNQFKDNILYIIQNKINIVDILFFIEQLLEQIEQYIKIIDSIKYDEYYNKNEDKNRKSFLKIYEILKMNVFK